MFRPRSCRVALCCLTMLLPLACERAASKRAKALAGTYVREEEIPAGRVRRELTLRADGRWTMRQQADAGGQPVVDATATGTFAVEGAALAMSSPETGVLRYTVRGDTLWPRRGPESAMAETVTGMDMLKDEPFLVRRR